MKKITTMAAFLFMGMAMNAQVTFEGVSDFGKIKNINYHPTIQNKLYASSNANHILVSNDNGTTWSVLYSIPSSQSHINNLKFIDNTHLSFSLRGTSEGVYIFNTVTNSIETSIATPETAPGSAIMTYALFDSSGNDVLVHVSYNDLNSFSAKSKVYYTKNGGLDWELIYFSDDHNTVQVNNVAFSPTSKAKLFIARSLGAQGENGGLLISEDAAVTWTEKLPGSPYYAISFNPNNAEDILLGTFISFGETEEHLYRSIDGGDTWSTQPITFTDQTLNCINAITFNAADPNKIIIMEENEIIKTNDGGVTWTSFPYQVTSTTYYYGLDASYNPFNVNQVAISTDYYPLISSDGGETVSKIDLPYYNVSGVGYGNDRVYYGAQGGRLAKNNISGATSIFEAEPPTRFNPKNHYFYADPNLDGRVFNLSTRGFFGGSFSVSTDYGQTYTDLFENYATDLQEVLVDPSNSNIVYVATRNGDSGQLSKVNFADLTNVIVDNVSVPEIPGSEEGTVTVITGFSITPTNANEMFITIADKFFKSTDAGLTWIERNDGLTLNPFSDLIFDMQRNPLNLNHFLIASNNGIYSSIDAGENWTQILSGVDVKRVVFSPTQNGLIVATVHTSIFNEASIYYSADNGNEWNTVTNEQLLYIQSYNMDYHFDGNDIIAYIATTDLGLLKYTIEDATLGIKNPNAAVNAIKIYPNPASDVLNILITENNFEIEKTEIYTITGQKVLESNKKTISVSSLSPGIYVVKIKADNNTNYTQKLVKK